MNRRLAIVLGVAFMVNGCALDNLKKFSFFHKKSVAKETKKVEVVEENNTTNKVIKKIKTTKSDTSSLTKPKKLKKVKKSKTIKHKIAHKSKPKKLKPEPFSIKSHKEDPELLGPQTTLKKNPIS